MSLPGISEFSVRTLCRKIPARLLLSQFPLRSAGRRCQDHCRHLSTIKRLDVVASQFSHPGWSVPPSMSLMLPT